MSSGKAFPPRVWVHPERPMAAWTHDVGKDLGHIEFLSLKEHSALLEAKDKEIERLREALRKCVLWAECVSMKLENRNEINWTYLNDAREALAGGK